MTAPEFSRPVPLELIGDLVGDGGREESFAASASECAALARRFAWAAIDELTGTVRLTRVAGGVHAAGTLHARIVQNCVATRAPIPETIDEAFELNFVESVATPEGEEAELKEADLDTLPIEGGAVDLGEAAAQTLALAANPYPRAAGADPVSVRVGADGGAFAGLQALLKP